MHVCSYVCLSVCLSVCVCKCVCAGVDTTSGPPHPLVPADRVPVVLQKGAQLHAFPRRRLLSYGRTRFVSDQCSALFVTPVRLASIVCVYVFACTCACMSVCLFVCLPLCPPPPAAQQPVTAPRCGAMRAGRVRCPTALRGRDPWGLVWRAPGGAVGPGPCMRHPPALTPRPDPPPRPPA